MKLYSTNNKALRVSFEETVFNSMPTDGGLYMPVEIPAMDEGFFKEYHNYSLKEIAFKVASRLLQGAIPDIELQKIINEAINFKAPVRKIDEEVLVLELFHGPSLAFKDFGARFMSRVMAYFSKTDDQVLDVLVATSGDTGGAVALGFLGVPNTRVTILYPKNMVSVVQEIQLTTNGENISAIEVNGTFDDCQALVKQAFADEELNHKLRLTSANSINIARLIPQTFYYFAACSTLKRLGINKVKISVPSGNFGNLTAGIFASKMGLPIEGFIAATNANDTVPRFLKTGEYETKPSVKTYANAMDVGAPSNWARIMELFNNNSADLKKLVTAERFTDAETLSAITMLHEKFNYIACPHTAIAWLAIQKYKAENPEDDSTFVFFSTAHACKFPEVFPPAIADKIELPINLIQMEGKQISKMAMNVDFESFKEFLLLR